MLPAILFRSFFWPISSFVLLFLDGRDNQILPCLADTFDRVGDHSAALATIHYTLQSIATYRKGNWAINIPPPPSPMCVCVCVRGRKRCATRFIIIANTSSLESNRPSVRPLGNQSLFLIQRDTPMTPLSRKQSSIAHLIRRKGWPNFFIITCYFFEGEREAKNYR